MTAAPYQFFPDMPAEQYEALKADIAERGIQVPVDVDEDGNILDGHHRARAWRELQKNDELPTVVRSALTEEEKRTFARKANVLRRHLSRDQLRELVAQQVRDTPSFANSRIAQGLGVDDKTVAAIRERLESTSEIPRFEKLIGADGKARRNPAPREKRAQKFDDSDVKIFVKTLGGAAGDASDLPEDVRLAFFAAGIPAKSVVVMRGAAPRRRLSEADMSPWKGFVSALTELAGFEEEGAWAHVEWIAAHFGTPAEWLGEDGAQYRARFGLREPSKAFKQAASVEEGRE